MGNKAQEKEQIASLAVDKIFLEFDKDQSGFI